MKRTEFLMVSQPMSESLRLMMKYPAIIDVHEQLACDGKFLPMVVNEYDADVPFIGRMIRDIDGKSSWMGWGNGIRATKHEHLFVCMENRKRPITVAFEDTVEQPNMARLFLKEKDFDPKRFDHAIIAGHYRLYEHPSPAKEQEGCFLGGLIGSLAIYEVFRKNGSDMAALLSKHAASQGSSG